MIGLAWRGRGQLVALGCLIPLVAFMLLLIREIHTLQHGVVVAELQSRTVAAASALERYLSLQLGQLVTLGNSPLLERGDLKKFHLEMTRARANRPEWRTLILNDAQGQLLNTKFPPGSALPEVREPDSLREVFSTGRPQIGNLTHGSTALRQPVNHANGVRYVLTAVIETQALDGILANEFVPRGWRIQVFDGNQIVMARNVEPERTVGTRVPAHYDRVYQDGDDAFPIVTRDGEDAFAAVAPVHGTGWRLAITAPVAAVAAPYRKIEFILYAGAGVALAAAAAILLLILGRWRYAFDREGRRLAARAEAAETGSREKSVFLANMSHEMRTPLNAVIGFAELLENNTFGPLGHPKNAEYVHDIASSGRHLLSLINDLLDLSKIEAGKMEVDRAKIELAGAVQTALSLMRERAAQAGVTAVSTVAPGVQVMADGRLLMQMLLNLVSNAIKYSPGGRVIVSADHDERGIAIAVRDTGIGMSASELRRAVEPYVRGESHKAREQVGTGLGLAVTKGLAELHGGSLTLESAPGVGTVATIRLPQDRVMSGRSDNFSVAA